MTTILVKPLQEGVYLLQLNRAHTYNAFNATMISEINHALLELAATPTCKLLLIAAAGPHFSAGADLKWMQESIQETYENNLKDAEQFATMLVHLKEFPVPTLVLIQGHTYGGGIGIIACCDIAIAAHDANFCFSEVKWGLIPAIISPHIIRIMGQSRAKQLFFRATPFTASTAQSYGLIAELADSTSLWELGLKVANQLLQNSPHALRQLKTLLLALEQTSDYIEIQRLTTQALAKIRISPEAQEGLRAFLEKRQPHWLLPAINMFDI